MIAQPTQTAQPEDEGREILTLVQAFHRNPKAFTSGQTKQLKGLADQYGIPMEIPGSAGRAMANLAFGAVDSALFGILPDSMVDALTPGDETARSIGGFVGMFGGPAFAGRAASKWVMNASKKAAEAVKTAGTIKAAKDGIQGANNAHKAQKAFSDWKIESFLAKQKNPEMIASAVQWGITGGGGQLFNDPAQALLQAGMGAAGGAFFGRAQAAEEAAKKAAQTTTQKAATKSATGNVAGKGGVKKKSTQPGEGYYPEERAPIQETLRIPENASRPGLYDPATPYWERPMSPYEESPLTGQVVTTRNTRQLVPPTNKNRNVREVKAKYSVENGSPAPSGSGDPLFDNAGNPASMGDDFAAAGVPSAAARGARFTPDDVARGGLKPFMVGETLNATLVRQQPEATRLAIYEAMKAAGWKQDVIAMIVKQIEKSKGLGV